MNVGLLEREVAPLPIEQELDEELKRIEADAHHLLGVEPQKKPDYTLRKVLRELNIMPFSADSVSKYKRAVKDDAQKVLSRAAWKRLFRLINYDEHYRIRWANDKDWKSCKLAEYEDPVPAFALQTALRIKKAFFAHACTAPVFYVDYFGQRDPFLRVVAGGESYVVEVWDEARFDAKREV